LSSLDGSQRVEESITIRQPAHRKKIPNANMQPRPTLLVAEPEPQQALSVRKLVLETGKFNVLTAHSTREALDIFRLFPNLSAAVLVGESDIDANEIATHMKRADDKIPVIYLHPSVGGRCRHADHDLSSHEPEHLLELIRSLLGDPRTMPTELLKRA
jgi:CheY-like chemotaxis protein